MCDKIIESWHTLKENDTIFKRQRGLADYIKLMSQITDDGQVHKRVLRQGLQSFGKVPVNSAVVIHYTVEIEQAPGEFVVVDSTLMRGSPFTETQDNLLAGLEVGLQTMVKKEVAVFIIGPIYAYGKKGIPPRIPAMSRILCTVEVIDFHKEGSPDKIIALEEEDDVRGKQFQQIRKMAAKELKKGNRFKNSNDWFAASQCFDKGVRLLSTYRLKNEWEQDRQQRLLRKLYLNQAAVGLLLQRPELVCVCCREALEIRRDCPKALYRFGRAKLILEDVDTATRMFKEALRLKPNNTSIIKRLEEADREREKRIQLKEYNMRFSETFISFDDIVEYQEDDDDADELDMTLDDVDDGDTTLEEESQAKEGSDEESSVEDSGHMVYVADQVMTWEEAPKRLATFEDLHVNQMELATGVQQEFSSTSNESVNNMSDNTATKRSSESDEFYTPPNSTEQQLSGSSDLYGTPPSPNTAISFAAGENSGMSDSYDPRLDEDDISEVSESESLQAPRRCVELCLDGSRFINDESEFQDFTLEEMHEFQNGFDGFRIYLRGILDNAFKAFNDTSQDTDVRVPIQVCPETVQVMKLLSQELDFELELKMLSGHGISFIITK